MKLQQPEREREEANGDEVERKERRTLRAGCGRSSVHTQTVSAPCYGRGDTLLKARGLILFVYLNIFYKKN